MFKWISTLFTKDKKTIESKSPDSIIAVSFDEEMVYVEWPAKPRQTIAWSSLIGVAVETTDQGPFVEDVWWHLASKEIVVTFPSEATGTKEILSRLQKLPTFNNERLITAITCTQNQMFLLWDHEGRHQSP